MRYALKEKVWSWADTYTIADGSGEPVYLVKGKAFSWGKKLSFQDAAGNELAFISQKLMSLKPRFQIYRDGELFADVVKEYSWLKSVFTLDVPGPNDYEIEGTFWQHDYTFRRAGQTVATVSKEMWSWSDTYGVDIVDGEDDVAILATVVVIDLVCHEQKSG